MTFDTDTDTDTDRAPATSARIARRLLAPVILTAAIGSLLLALPPLRGVAREIAHLRPDWILAALALEVASCLAFVVIFRLYFDEVPAGAARELALTEQGSGALLPGGGVGALAIGGWLLRRVGMSTSAIIDRSSALFFLTSAVNVAALVGAGALLVAVRRRLAPSDLLSAGVPILGGLAAAGDRARDPDPDRAAHRERRWPSWLLDLASGITRARRVAAGAELAPARRRRLPRLRHRGARGDVRRHRPPAPARSARPRLSDRLPRQPDPGARAASACSREASPAP